MWGLYAGMANAAISIYAQAQLAQRLRPIPCRYCGRTKQTASHKSCDGCGAPKTVEMVMREIRVTSVGLGTLLPGVIR